MYGYTGFMNVDSDIRVCKLTFSIKFMSAKNPHKEVISGFCSRWSADFVQNRYEIIMSTEGS